MFIDVRDRYGKTQVVFEPEGGSELLAQASKLRTEDVVQVTGKVAHRPEGTTNSKLGTGEIQGGIVPSKLPAALPSPMEQWIAAIKGGAPMTVSN